LTCEKFRPACVAGAGDRNAGATTHRVGDAFRKSPYLIVQQGAASFALRVLEMSWIEPHLLSNTMDLHPFLVLFVLMLGAQLFGVIGAIIALPVTAIALGVIEGAQKIRSRRPAT